MSSIFGSTLLNNNSNSLIDINNNNNNNNNSSNNNNNNNNNNRLPTMPWTCSSFLVWSCKCPEPDIDRVAESNIAGKRSTNKFPEKVNVETMSLVMLLHQILTKHKSSLWKIKSCYIYVLKGILRLYYSNDSNTQKNTFILADWEKCNAIWKT